MSPEEWGYKNIPISHIVKDDHTTHLFVEFIKQQRETCKDRNADWFDALIQSDFWKTYPLWTMSTLDGEVWSIAAVQKHNFPTGVYRVMTRMFVKESHRKMDGFKYIHGKDYLHSPSKYLFPQQQMMVESIEGSKMIMTMEHIQRRRPLTIISNYFNRNYGTKFKVQPDMYLTFGNLNRCQAWQVCSSTNGPPALPSITVEEWKEKFPEAALSVRA